VANTAIQQQRLAESAHFHDRVKSAFANVAFQVIAQGRDDATEIKRYDYARKVLESLDAVTDSTVGWLVQRTNLTDPKVTSYDWDIPSPVTNATDADIQSQLMTDWNVLAGV
jgi:hypothetical protein